MLLKTDIKRSSTSDNKFCEVLALHIITGNLPNQK